MEQLKQGIIKLIGYGRFSTNLQDKVSIEDQMRQCKKACALKVWTFLDAPLFSDEGITGTTMFGRDGVLALIAAVKNKSRGFDGIIIDETSRLARKLSDILRICEIIAFHGAFVYFVRQQLDSRDPHFHELLIMHGAQDEAMVKSLGYEVHRSQEGRAVNGLVHGGHCLGYDHVAILDPTRMKQGLPKVVGVEAKINKAEAALINRIFELRATGLSHNAIARQLNKDKVPLPDPSRKITLSPFSMLKQ
jgi:site-specific DNA recombinase